MVAQYGVVARPKRAGKSSMVDVERLLGRLPNWRDADDEQVVVHEHEVFRPDVMPRIEEAVVASVYFCRHALALIAVAIRAAPGEIVEVIGSASPINRGEFR